MDQQQAMQMMAPILGVAIVVGVLFLAFIIFLCWRIFTKAGLSGALSLLILIWPIGLIVVLCVLAFSEWKVVPVPIAQLYPPNYPPPPPPSYPPVPPHQV